MPWWVTSPPSCQKRPSASSRMPLWRSRSISASLSGGRMSPAPAQVQELVLDLQLGLLELGTFQLLGGREREVVFELGQARLQATVLGGQGGDPLLVLSVRDDHVISLILVLDRV